MGYPVFPFPPNLESQRIELLFTQIKNALSGGLIGRILGEVIKRISL